MTNNVMPAILTALELEVHYGEQIILDKASLTVHEEDRIGLVGRNGAGKSTFLKIISGTMAPDSGEVARRKDLVTGYLSQDFTLDNSKNILRNILDGAASVLKLIEDYNNTPFNSPNKIVLEHKILEADAWNLDRHIENLTVKLGVPDINRDIVTLSGGEKRRVALARALISNPDLLILDEPTNHLDTSSIEWMENFLSGYKGTCIFVTHDRYFLDRIANRIVELSSGTFFSHQGNYTDYLQNKAERIAIQETEERKLQNFLKHELEWIRRSPSARRTKSKSRQDNFSELSNREKLPEELDPELIIPEPEKLGKKIAEFTGVGFNMNGKNLFEGFNFIFEPGRKLGVIGNNGAGKTTLLKIILGELYPTDGKIEIGERTQFNYIDQHRLLLNDEDTVFNAIGEGNETVKFGKRQMNIWTYLRKFLFTDDRINTKVGKLSGGEKSRLTLAKILLNGGNFLLLDEPTNDLDLPTLRILEEALISFEGCLVIVSHDRYFLNRVCNGVLAFEDEGKLYFSEGDYDYYIAKKKTRIKDDKSASAPVKKEDTRIKPSIRKLTWKEKKELETIEEDIIKAEGEIQRIENIFSSPDYYEKYAAQTNELNIQREEIQQKVLALYERWEELENIKNGNIS